MLFVSPHHYLSPIPSKASGSSLPRSRRGIHHSVGAQERFKICSCKRLLSGYLRLQGAGVFQRLSSSSVDYRWKMGSGTLLWGFLAGHPWVINSILCTPVSISIKWG